MLGGDAALAHSPIGQVSPRLTADLLRMVGERAVAQAAVRHLRDTGEILAGYWRDKGEMYMRGPAQAPRCGRVRQVRTTS